MGRFLIVLCSVQFVSQVLVLYSILLHVIYFLLFVYCLLRFYFLIIYAEDVSIALYFCHWFAVQNFITNTSLFFLVKKIYILISWGNYFLQLHECVGTALGAMGPENFLSLLPLNLGVPDLSESNLWLFPILKQYIVGARLNFFTNSILPMAEEMKRKSAMV